MNIFPKDYCLENTDITSLDDTEFCAGIPDFDRKGSIKLLIYYDLTDTGPKKNRHRTVCPFREHLAPRLILLRFSFFDTYSSARIRMALKAPHSPVSAGKGQN